MVNDQESKSGPAGLSQEIWLAIVGGGFVFLLLLIVLIIAIVNAFDTPAEQDVVEEPVEEVAEAMVFEAPRDEVKEEVMRRAESIGWDYAWKETRENELFTATEVVFSRRNRRAGLTIYWSSDEDYLQTSASNVEESEVAMRFMGALLVFSTMPGQEMPETLLEAFKE